MARIEERKRQESVEDHLHEVQAILAKHRLVERLEEELPRRALVKSLARKPGSGFADFSVSISIAGRSRRDDWAAHPSRPPQHHGDYAQQ